MPDLSLDLAAIAVAWYAVFVFSTTLHEASHAWAALRLGDRTAYLGGQVTLNPLPHLQREPVGMIVVPVVSFLLGGWMMGWASAPYDPSWALRHPRRAAWMALAGPAANLLLVLLAALCIRLGVAAGYFTNPPQTAFSRVVIAADADGRLAAALATLLSIIYMLNLTLFLFNLLPLPPLDGSAAVLLFLSRRAAEQYQQFVQQPGIALIGLLAAWAAFGRLFTPLFMLGLKLLYPGVEYTPNN